MVRAEPTTTGTAGIDTSHSTRFTVLIVSGIPHYIWTKLNAVRMVKQPSKAFAAGNKIDTS